MHSVAISNNLGEAYQRTGDLARAATRFTEAYDAARTSLDPQNANAIAATLNLARLRFETAQIEDGLQLARGSVALLEGSPEANPLQLSHARYVLAQGLRRAGAEDAARVQAEAAIALVQGEQLERSPEARRRAGELTEFLGRRAY